MLVEDNSNLRRREAADPPADAKTNFYYFMWAG